MSILQFLILTFLQMLSGFGILCLLRVYLKPSLFIPLSVLLGIATFSFVPFLMQLLFIPLTGFNIFTVLILACIALNLRIREGIKNFKPILLQSRFRIELYETVLLGFIAFIVFVSVWRCFYFPPTPRDLTSGAEVLAEYAVKEKTMINSVFTVNLESTNNPYKSPFITSLQVIFKYSGFPFGQVWLSSVFICFIIFLYHALRQNVHRLIAGFLIIIFLAIPEMYAYTFMVLFDYSNAVFFFLALYFLFEFFRNGQNNSLALAGLLMGIATYIRSETLVLAFLMALLIWWHHIRRWDSLTRIIISNTFFLLPSVFFYIVSVTIYLNYYLPVKYNVGGLINKDLFNLKPLWARFIDINSSLFFSENGIDYYGYFVFIFLVFLIVEIVFSERWRAEPKTWLYGILVIYFGYPLLGYLLPLLDVDNSTKRGMFKIFPLMLLHMGSSALLRKASAGIIKWEKT
jgi:hypothetical protein